MGRNINCKSNLSLFHDFKLEKIMLAGTNLGIGCPPVILTPIPLPVESCKR